MAAGTFPEAWQETCLVSIVKLGGTHYNYEAATEDIDIGEPDYPFEGVASVAGGRIAKQSPQEDGELTLKIYPTRVNQGDNYGLFQEFIGGTADSAEPIASNTTLSPGIHRARDQFMVAIAWTDDTAMNDATDASATDGKVALRFYCKNARIVSHKTSFADKILVTEVTFKYPAVNKAGTAQCFAWESTDDGDTSVLPALTYSAAL